MKRKIKRGLTLIEVVAALAILTISITVVYSAFSFSNNVWAKEKSNLELIGGNQSLAEGLKAFKKIKVTNISNNVGKDVYVFFDDYDDIYNAFQSDTTAQYNSNFKKATTANYAECQSLNLTYNKKYVALLKISDLNLITGGYLFYSSYKIDATVWDLKSPTEVKSQSQYYIGG